MRVWVRRAALQTFPFSGIKKHGKPVTHLAIFGTVTTARPTLQAQAVALLAFVTPVRKRSSWTLLDASAPHRVPPAFAAPARAQPCAAVIWVALNITLLADMARVGEHAGRTLLHTPPGKLDIPAGIAVRVRRTAAPTDTLIVAGHADLIFIGKAACRALPDARPRGLKVFADAACCTNAPHRLAESRALCALRVARRASALLVGEISLVAAVTTVSRVPVSAITRTASLVADGASRTFRVAIAWRTPVQVVSTKPVHSFLTCVAVNSGHSVLARAPPSVNVARGVCHNSCGIAAASDAAFSSMV